MVEHFSENGIVIPENFINSEIDIDNLIENSNVVLNDKILFEAQSDFHDIYVCENSVGKFLKYGISVQAGLINTPKYSGNIPYLNYFLLNYLLKKDAKKILLIGFGIGHLVNQFEQLFDELECIDAVDIEENVISIAEKHFGFKKSEKFNFYLQDALVFLRNNKKKYDIIITDVAGDEGIDDRFFQDEFFLNIKKSLVKDGVFSFNSCANTDFDECKETFYGFTVSKYKEHFKNFAVFNGKISTFTYYNSIYGLSKDDIFGALDITNAIFFATDSKLLENNLKNVAIEDLARIKKLGVDIDFYINDLHKIYKKNGF